ncbi:hypothetical protein [Spirulina sp. 06S082]|uniref:hypothetical protein n=1 Tax=Spirulina sp. 06S082 TaxID=3110248 RepID=UPI002B20B241|nr:hypothetical protein [Spirulina sp. 06S082]MEA5468186.1 hypothetical protein [Spirulina sp. 06S082]
MKFFEKVCFGFIVTFLLLCVTGVDNAISIIGLSIICTAGVSLVMWVPLWWLVGWIVVAIYQAIAKPSQGDRDRPVNPIKDANQQALVNYMKLAKSKGFSDTQISTRLRVEGWGNEEITEAQQLLSNNVR